MNDIIGAVYGLACLLLPTKTLKYYLSVFLLLKILLVVGFFTAVSAETSKMILFENYFAPPDNRSPKESIGAGARY